MGIKKCFNVAITILGDKKENKERMEHCTKLFFINEFFKFFISQVKNMPFLSRFLNFTVQMFRKKRHSLHPIC